MSPAIAWSLALAAVSLVTAIVACKLMPKRPLHAAPSIAGNIAVIGFGAFAGSLIGALLNFIWSFVP